MLSRHGLSTHIACSSNVSSVRLEGPDWDALNDELLSEGQVSIAGGDRICIDDDNEIEDGVSDFSLLPMLNCCSYLVLVDGRGWNGFNATFWSRLQALSAYFISASDAKLT